MISLLLLASSVAGVGAAVDRATHAAASPRAVPSPPASPPVKRGISPNATNAPPGLASSTLLESPSFPSSLHDRFPSLTWSHTPVSIAWDLNHPSASRVRMCKLDWDRYHAAPAVMPMFEDLVEQSGCRSRDDSEATRVRSMRERRQAEADAADAARTFVPSFVMLTLGDLEAEYAERGCLHANERGEHTPACAPSGVLFHESRCGSTLFANMLASLASVQMYSEAGPPSATIRQEALPVHVRVHFLRVVVAAMQRPMVAAMAGQRHGEWQPKYMYIKTQHTTSLWLEVYQRAFPRMPWIYIHREPVEVLMSLLRDGASSPAANAPLSEHLTERHLPYMNNTPCMRSRVTAPEYLRNLTGVRDVYSAAAYPAEDWCAQDLAWVMASAVRAAIRARRAALARALAFSGGVRNESVMARAAMVNVANGSAFAAAVTAAAPKCITVQDGMVLDAGTETGVVMGVGLGLIVDYRDLPLVVPLLLDTHLRPMRTFHPDNDEFAAVRPDACFSVTVPRAAMEDVDWTAAAGPGRVQSDFMLSPDDVDLVMAASSMYSKARATKEQLAALRHAPGGIRPFQRTGAGRLRAARSWSNINVQGNYVSDVKAKHAYAWPALRYAAARYMTDIRTVMLGFNVPFDAVNTTHANGTVVAALGGNETSAAALVAASSEDLFDARTYAADALGSWVTLPVNSSSARVVTFLATPVKTEDEDSSTGLLDVGRGLLARVSQLVLTTGTASVATMEYDAARVPMQSYPQMFPLQQILLEWNPDIISPSGAFGKHASLHAYDAQVSSDGIVKSHNAIQVPFVLYNVAALEKAVDKYSDDDRLLDALGRDTLYNIEASESAYFLVWNAPAAVPGDDSKTRLVKGAPTRTRLHAWTAADWLRRAYRYGQAYLDEESDQLPPWWGSQEHQCPRARGFDRFSPPADWYGTLPAALSALIARKIEQSFASGKNATAQAWARTHVAASFAADVVGLYALPSRRAHVTSLSRARTTHTALRIDLPPAVGGNISGRVTAQKAVPFFFPSNSSNRADIRIAALLGLPASPPPDVRCRFAAAGAAELPHFHTHRIVMAVVRGFVRVIMTPPADCPRLQLQTEGPTTRHATKPWTTPQVIETLQGVRGLEAVLEPGQILVIPAFWSYTLVSLTLSFQCTAHASEIPSSALAMSACGFTFAPTEPAPLNRTIVISPPRRTFPPITTATLVNLTLVEEVAALQHAAIVENDGHKSSSKLRNDTPPAAPTPLPSIAPHTLLKLGRLLQLLDFRDEHFPVPGSAVQPSERPPPSQRNSSVAADTVRAAASTRVIASSTLSTGANVTRARVVMRDITNTSTASISSRRPRSILPGVGTPGSPSSVPRPGDAVSYTYTASTASSRLPRATPPGMRSPASPSAPLHAATVSRVSNGSTAASRYPRAILPGVRTPLSPSAAPVGADSAKIHVHMSSAAAPADAPLRGKKHRDPRVRGHTGKLNVRRGHARVQALAAAAVVEGIQPEERKLDAAVVTSVVDMPPPQQSADEMVHKMSSATLVTVRYLLAALTCVVLAFGLRWHILSPRCCCRKPAGRPNAPRISIKFR